MAASLEERMDSRIDLNGPGGCWLWLAGKDSSGYGIIKVDGRKVGAHRAAYRLIVGPIPPGLQIDHLCRVRACVNPSHLEIVTGRQNTLRGASFSAVNAAKTHCKHGHEFTPANTYHDQKLNARHCRSCRAARRQQVAA